MRSTAFIAASLFAALVFVTGNTSAHAQSQQNQNPVSASAEKRKIVEVKSGDSLSKIAKKHNSTYPRLFYANTQVKDPDLIYAGQKLKVPHPSEKLKKRPMPEEVSQQSVRTAAAPTQQTQRAAYSSPTVNGGVWDRLAACESGGNWGINTGNGYYGGLQFSLSTWRAVGGSGYPHQASKAEQIKRGQILQAQSGWGQWPACSAKLGLR